MGTWALPDTQEKVKIAIKAVHDLHTIKGVLHSVVGSDVIFDYIDSAIDEIKYFVRESSAATDEDREALLTKEEKSGS